MHNSCPVRNDKKPDMRTYGVFFPNELHSDSALVTSGELHWLNEHQVASVEVLMEFNVALCLGALSVGWAVDLDLHESHVVK